MVTLEDADNYFMVSLRDVNSFMVSLGYVDDILMIKRC